MIDGIMDGYGFDGRSLSGVELATDDSSIFFALEFLLPLRPGGAGLTANSCAPGIGGGRNEEDGDGNGDDDGRVSSERDRGGPRSECAVGKEEHNQ